ncbi:hypothetical protein ACEQPO_26825 [Bacillus sp. SL00103]
MYRQHQSGIPEVNNMNSSLLIMHQIDGTKEYVREQNDVIFIENEENRGFAKGCNQGAKKRQEIAFSFK